jgi:exosortase/archaeosortase family protein
MAVKISKSVVVYLAKFFGIFGLCYFGTLAIIGLAAPGGLYSPFIDHHLDYVTWIKNSLIGATGWILSLFHTSTTVEPGFMIRFTGGKGVIIAMSCVGYGVYSFWIAFVAANRGTFLKKMVWISSGLLLLWGINVIRITLLLVAVNKNWPMPLGIDHHTWFNIVAYTFIFIMIWFYDRTMGQKVFHISK